MYKARGTALPLDLAAEVSPPTFCFLLRAPTKHIPFYVLLSVVYFGAEAHTTRAFSCFIICGLLWSRGSQNTCLLMQYYLWFTF